MDFGTIASNITTRLNRPDKLDDAYEAINDAVAYCTANGDFANDIVESEVTVSATVYTQSIVISTSFTRFRKVKYLRPEGFNRYLKWQDPSRIFDDKDQECTDVWYRAGDNLVIKTSSYVDNILYGIYQYPLRMSADADTHWMLDQIYPAIFNLAASDLWESIGNDSEAARYKRKGEEFFISFRRDFADGVAHS